jgi:hypothetical protein
LVTPGEADDACARRPYLLGDYLHIPAGSKRDDLKHVRVRANNSKCMTPNASCTPDDCHADAPRGKRRGDERHEGRMGKGRLPVMRKGCRPVAVLHATPSQRAS